MKIIELGVPPTGAGGDTPRSANIKINDNFSDISKAIGGSTSIEELKKALSLDKFAQNPKLNTVVSAPDIDAAIIISNDGWGIYTTDPNFSRALPIKDGGTGSSTQEGAKISLGLDRFVQQGDLNTFVISPDKNLLVNLQNNNISLWRNSDNKSFNIWTELNTTVDGNGYIRSASPIVKIFTNTIEKNEEAEKQPITFEHPEIGLYILKGSLGFAQTGWYIETPRDRNGNTLFSIEYTTMQNGDIQIRCYEKMMNQQTGNIESNTSAPVDIPETRWIDVRLHEPKKGEPPVNPGITDKYGNVAPSQYHYLENREWCITDQDKLKLEFENLQSMKSLTRRQFRLALVMSGYNLADIELLITNIEDPLRRQIVLIEWHDATIFERTNENLLLMAEIIGLSSDQINILWEKALSL